MRACVWKESIAEFLAFDAFYSHAIVFIIFIFDFVQGHRFLPNRNEFKPRRYDADQAPKLQINEGVLLLLFCMSVCRV